MYEGDNLKDPDQYRAVNLFLELKEACWLQI